MDANGITIKLQDVLGVQATPGVANEPPRMAAKFWNEHSGKQTSLKKFFGRQPEDTQSLDKSSTPSLVSDSSIPAEPVAKPPLPASSKSHDLTNPLSPSLSTSTPSPASKRKITLETSNSSKRLKLKNETVKPKEKNTGKSTIASFFSQPKTRNSQTTAFSSTVSKGKDKVIGTQPLADNHISPSDGLTQADEDSDYRMALLLSSQDSIPSSSQGRPEKETKQAWNNLLAPIQPPKCVVHREPAKELTVTKQGPNKGKKFFICSR
jgi:AP endonuclease 2